MQSMSIKKFEQIKAVNYWEKAPQHVGFIRESYLTAVVSYIGSQLLKVLIGQRRSGKSTILKQVISALLKQGTPKQNILYLNFELNEVRFIQSADGLLEVIDHFFKALKPKGKVYLFLDEIQEVEGWESVVNGYLANERHDIEFFLTGSNAHLLSTELSTFVTGRYVEIPVYPFSFAEYVALKGGELNKAQLIVYLEDSGIPELLSLKEKQQKVSYLNALKDSVLMNDIVKRFNIKNTKLLISLLDFIIDNIGRLFSLNSITKKLNASGMNVSAITVGNYLDYLERTYLIHDIRRYDVKGKKILEGERKYYLNDLGFWNYLQSSFDGGVTRRLGNYVYLALLQSGYTVYVGNIYNLEVDFVAEKNQQTIYLQVTYLLHGEDVVEREYGSLEKIKDNWPKWVVSLDDMSFPPKNGILHIPAWDLFKHLN